MNFRNVGMQRPVQCPWKHNMSEHSALPWNGRQNECYGYGQGMWYVRIPCGVQGNIHQHILFSTIYCVYLYLLAMSLVIRHGTGMSKSACSPSTISTVVSRCSKLRHTEIVRQPGSNAEFCSVPTEPKGAHSILGNLKTPRSAQVWKQNKCLKFRRR